MIQPSGQVNALTGWADQQDADDFDATVMRDIGTHHRRLPPRCPGAYERRNQGKTALILVVRQRLPLGFWLLQPMRRSTYHTPLG